MKYEWKNISTVDSKSYTCGHCGCKIASEKGWIAYLGNSKAHIYICHLCSQPTFFDIFGKQSPGYSFGNDVKNIDDKSVGDLYREMRNCMSVSAYTPAVLSARKLLMHIAVSKGAKENQGFVEYVEFLSDKNFIPPDAKGWVNHIRNKGNEANHEILLMHQKDAEELISFIEMLLKLIYEFPARIKEV